MAESIKIKVEFRPGLEKKLLIPEKIQAHVGDNIRWQLSIKEPFHYPPDYRIRFQVYFSKDSPFKWNIESLQIIGFPFAPYFEGEITDLASGVAEKPGDYKYGIKVVRLKTRVEINNTEEEEELIEDDDPYLSIL